MTLFSIEMNEEAESTMREAISIIPDHPEFYFSLGVLLGKLNRLKVRMYYHFLYWKFNSMIKTIMCLDPIN